MHDRLNHADRLYILADQGDPIAIGELYRAAKRRGDAVVCVSPARQYLTVPPLSGGWGWVEVHVAAWAEQIGCELDVQRFREELTPQVLRFAEGSAWREVTSYVILRRSTVSRPPLDEVLGCDLTALAYENGERDVRLEAMLDTRGLPPFAGAAAWDSIEPACGDWFAYWEGCGGRMMHVLCSACDLAPYPTVTVTVDAEAWAAQVRGRIDSLMERFGLDTAQADDLTMLAVLATGIPRAEGESDAEYRARIIRHWADPSTPPP